MKLISTLTGAAMVAGGAAKLLRVPAYEELVKSLDWTDEERQRIGTAELIGGVLMLLSPTRRLGAGVVLAASGVALSTELKSGETQLAAARAGIMVAALLVAAAG